MCYVAIPGQTGCLAVHDVPKLIRRRIFTKKVASKKTDSVILPNCAPRFCGGTLVKTFLTWDQKELKYERRDKNAKARRSTARHLVFNARESHRRINRMRSI
ncbi:MAG: hypothetical protein Q8P17_00360 [bacterium]|nr:hypothetical protein [bacterium]